MKNLSFLLTVPSQVQIQIFRDSFGELVSQSQSQAIVVRKLFSHYLNESLDSLLSVKSLGDQSTNEQSQLLRLTGPLGSVVFSVPSFLFVQLLKQPSKISNSISESQQASTLSSLLQKQLSNYTYQHLLSGQVLSLPADSNIVQTLYTVKSHLKNLFQGVTEGFMVKLNLVGLFYSVRLKRQQMSDGSFLSFLRLNIGRSHPVVIQVPQDILISYKQVNFIKTIFIYGISLERVMKVASEIRSLSPVERYKGKGFRYSDEFVTIKAKK